MHILAVGKTGHGKSSTLNSILMRRIAPNSPQVLPVFHTTIMDTGSSVTSDVQLETTVCAGETLHLIDTPGLCDTHYLPPGDKMAAVINNMKSSMAKCGQGPNCVLFVLNYCSPRFTDEEFSTFRVLRDIFSPVMFQRFGIIVFTHKGNFIKDQARANPRMTFQQWCYAQRDPNMCELLQLCNYRCIGFDNYDPNEAQRQELVAMIRWMNPRGERYTHQLFQQAAQERKYLLQSEHVQTINNMVNQKIGSMRNTMANHHDVTSQLIKLDEVKENAEFLLGNLTNLEYAPGLLDAPIRSVQLLIETIISQESAVKAQALDEDRKKAVKRAVLTGVISSVVPGVLDSMSGTASNVVGQAGEKFVGEAGEELVGKAGENLGIKAGELMVGEAGEAVVGKAGEAVASEAGEKLAETVANTLSNETGEYISEKFVDRFAQHLSNNSTLNITERTCDYISHEAVEKVVERSLSLSTDQSAKTIGERSAHITTETFSKKAVNSVTASAAASGSSVAVDPIMKEVENGGFNFERTVEKAATAIKDNITNPAVALPFMAGVVLPCAGAPILAAAGAQAGLQYLLDNSGEKEREKKITQAREARARNVRRRNEFQRFRVTDF